MAWNWQHEDWPNFRFDVDSLAAAEAEFLRQGGILLGAVKHLAPLDSRNIASEILTAEAITTSAIEGEYLERASVHSSIRRHLGLAAEKRRPGPREQGMADLANDQIRTFADPLKHETLFQWHHMIMMDREDEHGIGAYRTHEAPMQIVSGPVSRQRVHFEAPPSGQVRAEMAAFVNWFNSSPGRMGALTRSGIAHIYFESIHPFVDGNGRIGRAISEKALAQGLGGFGHVMLSTEIESRRTKYYSALEQASSALDISNWLLWFAEVALAGQRRALKWVEFTIQKAKLMDQLRGQINHRQERALLRMFEEGPSGFKGGLSSANYQKITGASPATAGRDLSELVERNALFATGIGKGRRYWLAANAADSTNRSD